MRVLRTSCDAPSLTGCALFALTLTMSTLATGIGTRTLVMMPVMTKALTSASAIFTRATCSGAVSHLDVSDQIQRKKEHDIRGLKRQSADTLRHGAAKGRKVLLVWDRAGIDFAQWFKWKHNSGLYLLSRCKENMSLMVCGQLAFDRRDPLNAGVLADELVSPSSVGITLRRVFGMQARGAASSLSPI